MDVGIAQPFPVNTILIMAYVKALYFKALRVVRLAIDCFPAEREGPDEEVVKEKKIDRHHKTETCDESP